MVQDGPTHLSDTARRASVIDPLIPRPPADVATLRSAVSRMVSRQWDAHVAELHIGPETHAAKARFIAEMYARACYSMLLVSAEGPASIRLPVLVTSILPLWRGLAIVLGRVLLSSLDRLLPQAVHCQLLLMSALMGTLDVVLDEAAASGGEAALRIASMLTRQSHATLSPGEEALVTLARNVRRDESAWQRDYWEAVLQPSVFQYCRAEALAVAHAPDPERMGHRRAGIDAAIKGMWYVVGPLIGLGFTSERYAQFERPGWNREQTWMADTSLLMQMIDDWVDQDEDRNARVTPVLSGEWDLHSIEELYRKTTRDLTAMLNGNRIKNRVLQQLFLDLYNDYLHTALSAMRSGVAS